MKLEELAGKSKNVLKPYGETETLLYYSIVAKQLEKFLKDKKIAAKNLLTKGPQLLKRGSEMEPLYVEELKEVDEEFLKKRTGTHLKEAKDLSKTQEKIWRYFLPRKLNDFYYATNNEGIGKPIERIFLDIDRKEQKPEQAQTVCKELAKQIQEDKKFQELIGENKLFPMWTGKSFHIYILLKKELKPEFYEKHLLYTKKSPTETFTGKWCKEIKESTGIETEGGHERVKGRINIDPSQTPSGKLARSPFSLHLKDAKNIDGIALPLTLKELEDKKLVEKLEKYTPEKVLNELKELKRKMN